MRQPETISEVVETGLCIGCGLCEAIAPDRWTMRMTPEGRLRPASIASDPVADAEILAACPGATVEADTSTAPFQDKVWGGYTSMTRAWAKDPDTRFRAATGGVLTALGMWLLNSGRAAFILHCAADPDAPMRSRWVISDHAEQVYRRAGSRYGPSDTLAGLEKALSCGQRFAIIAKPCDANAIRARAKTDPRLDDLLIAVLVMVCGGASDLGKSHAVLEEYDLKEKDVTLFRYRGFGNPGPTRIETRDGRAFEKTYLDMWADESGWRIQTRCKLCPDAIGEASDLAAADIWPGGAPTGEDAGFNGVICRTAKGQALMDAAIADGALASEKALGPRDFDDFQPHQVNKKHAIAARLRGLSKAGAPVYHHTGLRIDVLDAADEREEDGAEQRVRSGRFAENMPDPTETKHG
ncbi:Coenzyme F420 hydrogenase/dehydrogenase, beta subunit C-terminal domain [Ruegeria arenilitoris]|uniref:Coenzyme F420 hydrogenase/dehydrogenase, beta subunit C-terminal domain n=1 Tax=Ruegeria arenilitoris TaxID=1173585 RepID=UPI001480EC66|nr:Coenzyme F420 hydrogenase/dehydrogenase, beta subunit C-terminal domain [Ruegeria arenilitoris]